MRNYQQLVALHGKYKDQGLEVIAFPCNCFGGSTPMGDGKGQELATNELIKAKAVDKYGVAFPMMAKVEAVNGPNTHPVYRFLRSATLSNQSPGESKIEWNFGKFVVDREGQVRKRYGPNVDPESWDDEQAGSKVQNWLKGSF